MNLLMKVGKNHYSYLISIITGLVPLLLVSLLSVNNGAEFMGDFFYYLSIIAMTQVVVDYGFNFTAIRMVSSAIKAKGVNGGWQKFLEVILSKIFISIPLVLLSVGMWWLGVVGNKTILCIVFGCVLSVCDISYLFYALNKSIFYTSTLLLFKVLALAPLYFFGQSIAGAILIVILPSILVSAASLLVLYYYNRELFIFKDYKFYFSFMGCLKDGFNYFISSFFASIIAVSWPVFLSFFLTNTELGVYGVANKIVRGLVSFFSPLPLFFVGRDDVEVASYSLIVKLIFSLGMLSPILVLIAIPENAYHYFLGTDYEGLKEISILYSISYLFICISMFSVTLLIIKKKEIMLTWIVLLAWVSSLVMLIFEPIYMPVIFELCFAMISLLYVIKLKKV